MNVKPDVAPSSAANSSRRKASWQQSFTLKKPGNVIAFSGASAGLHVVRARPVTRRQRSRGAGSQKTLDVEKRGVSQKAKQKKGVTRDDLIARVVEL